MGFVAHSLFSVFAAFMPIRSDAARTLSFFAVLKTGERSAAKNSMPQFRDRQTRAAIAMMGRLDSAELATEMGSRTHAVIPAIAIAVTCGFPSLRRQKFALLTAQRAVRHA